MKYETRLREDPPNESLSSPRAPVGVWGGLDLVPLRDSRKGPSVGEGFTVQHYGRDDNSVTCTSKKCFQLTKPASESSGKRMKMLGCLSFRSKSLVWGLRQLSPTLLCSLQNTQATPQRRRKTPHLIPTASSREPLPSLLPAPVQAGLEQRAVPWPRQPGDRPQAQTHGEEGLQAVLADLRNRTASNLTSAGAVPRACCFQAGFGLLVFI